jgi:hypothetical protein
MPRTIIQQPSCWAVETCIQISTPKGSLTPEDVEARQSPSFRIFFPFQVRLSSPRVLARIPKSDDDNVLPSFQNQQLKRMQPYSLTMFTPDACLAHPPHSPTTHLGFSARSLISCQVSQFCGKPHRPAPLSSFKRLSRRRLEQPCQPSPKHSIPGPN